MKKMHWLDKIIELIGDQPKEKKDEKKELLGVIENAKTRNLISSTSSNMIEGVFRLEQKNVSEVMIPSAEVDTINYKDSLSKIIDKLISTGHSRFPVIKEAGDTDSIMGILLVKDLFALINSPDEQKNFHVKKFLRKPLLVPEGKKLSELLFDFQQQNTHIAIVIDQFGLISGIVTIDNITTEILGKIEDEHEKKKRPKIKRIRKGVYRVRANLSLDKFNAFFKTNLSGDGIETLAGFALYKIGYIPKTGHQFRAVGLEFKINKATERKIISIEITPDKEIEGADDINP